MQDRKAIIKNLKPVVHQMAAHESAHMLLLTLMDVVDDTVLVNKSIFTELQPHVLDLATNKFGRIPLLYPFVGRMTRLLSPAVIAQVEQMDPIREATRYSMTSDLQHIPSSPLPLLSIIGLHCQISIANTPIVRRTLKLGGRNCERTYHRLFCRASPTTQQNW
jgi:hypothetical protein